MTPRKPDEKTLLVVEDDNIFREGLASLLRRAGYRVITVDNGGAALTRLEEGLVPDLILLDMMMPAARDGWHFLAERRHDPTLAEIPLVIVTSLGVASPEWAAALGAVGVLRKPLELDALVSEVRSRV